ncbi:MAG: hypothetical protein ACXWN8_14375 [Isosphaeraceae bacterium]
MKPKTAQTPARTVARRQALKARVLEPMELKPGLWIDVEFRHDNDSLLFRRDFQ